MQKKIRFGLSAVATGALVLLAANPAHAALPTPHFTQVNQVADQPGKANIPDANLVNAWGLALSPTSPLWSANNGTNTATLYSGGLGGAPVAKVGLTVAIPGGAPTGQVFNDTTDFVVHVGANSAPATFMFVSEGGQVTAWSGPISGTNASIVGHDNGAIYKGMALLHASTGNYLLATDFHHGRVDVYDNGFQLVHPTALTFNDPTLPKGYAPFNVFVVGDKVYVSYAKQDADKEDEVDGAGLGFVDVYTVDGYHSHPVRQRIASRGPLDAPWGMTIAPASFGKFAGALLVGNFGDGHILVFKNGQFLGALRDATNHRIHIDGLWALLPGTASTGGVGTLWFSAGPVHESHGLVGQLIPTV